MQTFVRHNNLIINEDFVDLLRDNGLDTFQALRDCSSGFPLKKNRFRSVDRLEMGNRIFYLKRHFWPYRERLRSVIPLSAKEDAKNEWNNMLLLDALGFNTMTPVAFGEDTACGLTSFSLTLTENIYGAEKLEVFFPKQFRPPLTHENILYKRTIIKKLGLLARDLHLNGLNHQDFYLGHILIKKEEDTFFIIDLQRMHKNKTISMHDKIKDLGQLLYSAKQQGVFTKTDLLRFFHAYTGSNTITPDDRKLAKSIMSKTDKISRHDAKLQAKKNRLKVN